jgi:archaellum component FlaF (FlaF/FlaG flagellin family)
MGLKETIQNAATTAFSAIGNLAEVVTYVQVSARQQEYSPTTGVVDALSLKHSGVDALFTEYSAREIDGSVIKPKDNKVLIPGNEVTFTPKQGDMIERASSEVWRVVNVEIDPAEALWQLQCRMRDDAPNT